MNIKKQSEQLLSQIEILKIEFYEYESKSYIAIYTDSGFLRYTMSNEKFDLMNSILINNFFNENFYNLEGMDDLEEDNEELFEEVFEETLTMFSDSVEAYLIKITKENEQFKKIVS